METDPTLRQRRREVKLEKMLVGADHGWLKRESKPFKPLFLHRVLVENPTLAIDLRDFVANWLAEWALPEYGRALADAIGRNLGLREAAREHRVDHRRLSDLNRGLQEALKEVL